MSTNIQVAVTEVKKQNMSGNHRSSRVFFSHHTPPPPNQRWPFSWLLRSLLPWFSLSFYQLLICHSTIWFSIPFWLTLGKWEMDSSCSTLFVRSIHLTPLVVAVTGLGRCCLVFHWRNVLTFLHPFLVGTLGRCFGEHAAYVSWWTLASMPLRT